MENGLYILDKLKVSVVTPASLLITTTVDLSSFCLSP
jgi:hypothetical protein